MHQSVWLAVRPSSSSAESLETREASDRARLESVASPPPLHLRLGLGREGQWMRERDAVIVSVTNHRPHFSSVIIAAESRPHLKCSVDGRQGVQLAYEHRSINNLVTLCFTVHIVFCMHTSTCNALLFLPTCQSAFAKFVVGITRNSFSSLFLSFSPLVESRV